MTLIKKQSQFTEKERIHFVAELWNNITYKDKELRLEVTSSDKALITGGDHSFYAQAVIWDGDKIAYHTLDKKTLTQDQCLLFCNDVGENPDKYLKQ